jgi:ketosteroid isomerase-like protein
MNTAWQVRTNKKIFVTLATVKSTIIIKIPVTCVDWVAAANKHYPSSHQWSCLMAKRSYFSLFIIVLFISVFVGCGQQESLTRQDIEVFYTKLEEAINARDVDLVLDSVSDDVEINLTMLTPDGSQEMELTKEQYADNMKKTFKVADDYSYRIEEMGITIAAGGNSAVVQLRVLEKISVEDQTLSAISNGESEIKLVNGKLQAVRIDGIVMIK